MECLFSMYFEQTFAGTAPAEECCLFCELYLEQRWDCCGSIKGSRLLALPSLLGIDRVEMTTMFQKERNLLSGLCSLIRNKEYSDLWRALLVFIFTISVFSFLLYLLPQMMCIRTCGWKYSYRKIALLYCLCLVSKSMLLLSAAYLHDPERLKL